MWAGEYVSSKMAVWSAAQKSEEILGNLAFRSHYDNIKKFLEMIWRLQSLIRNNALLIRGKKLVFPRTTLSDKISADKIFGGQYFSADKIFGTMSAVLSDEKIFIGFLFPHTLYKKNMF